MSTHAVIGFCFVGWDGYYGPVETAHAVCVAQSEQEAQGQLEELRRRAGIADSRLNAWREANPKPRLSADVMSEEEKIWWLRYRGLVRELCNGLGIVPDRWSASASFASVRFEVHEIRVRIEAS